MPTIRCLIPPVANRKEGVVLYHAGDESPISEVTGFWQGLVDRGVVELVKSARAKPKGDVSRNPDAPKPGRTYDLGGKVVQVVSVSEKAAIVSHEGAKKPYPVALSKWVGVEIPGADSEAASEEE